MIFTAAIVLFFVAPRFVGVYTDWLWFQEVDHAQVFLKTLSAQAALGAAVFALAFAILFVNVRLAQDALRRFSFTVFGPTGPKEISLDLARLRPLFALGAIVGAALIALYGSSKWELWQFASNAVPVGKLDPIFGRDVSFYLFTLPFLQFAQSLALTTVVLAAAAVVGAHVLGRSLMLDPAGGLRITAEARKHLAWLAAVAFLLLAFRAWLEIPGLLTTPSGIVYGASYVDVHARIPAQWALVVVCVIGAFLAVYQTQVERLWPIFAAVAGYVGVVILGAIAANILQRFVVAPNEQVRETPYIAHAIEATRAGFALDRVTERPLSGEATLTRADIERNADTFENVPLWNEKPLLDAFGQLQEIRTYYDFFSVDTDRYVIDGKYRQVMLSAREMNSKALPSGTWINERLTFTHGYGLTLGPVNEVTPEGLPVLFMKDLPLSSSINLEVTQPGIYFGEMSNDHVFVKTGTKEFDYPTGDGNVFGTYEGKGGIELTNAWRRFLFAVRFGSPDTFFSPNLTSESRVLMYRRISERVERIAPFLIYDEDPYLAISGGRLVWIQDAYTVSNRYPYSTPTGNGGINYIRNAVKATIDAYDGTVTFYLMDPADPIAATLAKVFPELFRPLDEMPKDLRERLRYPQGIFRLQATMFATFHMTNPATFYNREDQWDIPTLEQGDQAARMEPYYTIMKLPGEASAEYIQMLPYTPRQKDNLAAWMVARSDGANYGQLMVFEFPKQTVIFGPRQIAARISQDQVIAPQITLWNQQGSEVIQGSLLVIPVEESLVYIRPLYLRAANGRIPELTRVVVAYRNQIVMEESLGEALGRLFPADGRAIPLAGGRAAGSSLSGPGAATKPAAGAAAGAGAPAELEGDLASRAQTHYENAVKAQRDGDWARYGDELQRLGEVLKQLNR